MTIFPVTFACCLHHDSVLLVYSLCVLPGEIGRFYNKDPVYNWNCVTRTLRPLSASTFVGYPPGDCPQRCYQHRNCSQCLLSQGVEGGSQMCVWSETLREVGMMAAMMVMM